MNITIVMMENKTLYVQKASFEQQVHLKRIIAEGHGSFEFVQDQRTYVVNIANVLYIELGASA